LPDARIRRLKRFVNVSHLIPRSKEDLFAAANRSLQLVAEYTVGLMGRTPDYMNVTFAGFAGRADEWAIAGNDNGAANLVAYQKFLRARKDLALTHTIVQPTIDKSQGDAPRARKRTSALRKVADTRATGYWFAGAPNSGDNSRPFADEIASLSCSAACLRVQTPTRLLVLCIPMNTHRD